MKPDEVVQVCRPYGALVLLTLATLQDERGGFEPEHHAWVVVSL